MIEVQLHLHGGPTERQELPTAPSIGSCIHGSQHLQLHPRLPASAAASTAPSIGSCIHGSQHLQLHPLSDRRADELQASLATWGEQ